MSKLDNINANIEKLAASEKVTKAVLSELSRSLLDYVAIEGTWDIAAVNRTINVCTPMNRKTAILFFNALLPNKFDENTQAFGGLDKKRKDKQVEAIREFLSVEANDIWSWAEQNVKVEAKDPDYLGKIKKAIQKAVESQAVSPIDIVKAIAAGGLDLNAVIALMALGVPADVEAEQAMNADAEEAPAPQVVGAADVIAENDIPY